MSSKSLRQKFFPATFRMSLFVLKWFPPAVQLVFLDFAAVGKYLEPLEITVEKLEMNLKFLCKVQTRYDISPE